MKIKKFSDVEDNDTIYIVTLTNKSKHMITGGMVKTLVSAPLGSMVRLPTDALINRSHIIEIVKDHHETSNYIKSNKSLCEKYEIPEAYDEHIHFNFNLNTKYYLN